MFCANVHSIIKKSESNILTIIIPRHINRIKKISLNLKKMGFKVQIKNENDLIDRSAEIVLINYYGSVLKYLGITKQTSLSLRNETKCRQNAFHFINVFFCCPVSTNRG